MTTKEMISVMQAYNSGKQIQIGNADLDSWMDTKFDVEWNWGHNDYRVKPNKFAELANCIGDSEVESTTIVFGCHENTYKDGEKKLLYDTHIRKTLTEKMDYGNTVKFKLVAVNPFGEELLDEINKSRFSKQ